MADTNTQGDTVVDAQKGRTSSGQTTPYVADPWERGMSLMENEPVTSLSASGLEGSMPWEDTTIHASWNDTISAVPGAVSQVGKWPISGAAIHGRGAGMQNEKDLGTGESRLHLGGEVDNGGAYY